MRRRTKMRDDGQVFRVAVLLSLAVASSGPVVQVCDLDGRAWTPLTPASGEINLLVFIASDCPISNRYAPEIDRIAAAYAPRRVRTFLVYADSRAAASQVRAQVHEFHPSLRAPVIIDRGLALTEAAGATVTPEAVIVTGRGRVYRGRIDDWYENAGQARRAAQRHDLRDALDATLAGRPVAQPETTAIGCFIERGLK